MAIRHLQMSFLVPVGHEVGVARNLWGQMSAEERAVVGRLAAEFVLLHEAGSDQRVLVAPAQELEAAGLPFAGKSAGPR